jgi:hypothetical protein
MSKATDIANDIVATCRELGWTFEVRGSILDIHKHIRPGNNDDFVRADGEYYDILGRLPSTRAGSIWGTDGGGIGAMTAVNTGMFTMHKSGGDKRVLNALKKIKGVV